MYRFIGVSAAALAAGAAAAEFESAAPLAARGSAGRNFLQTLRQAAADREGRRLAAAAAGAVNGTDAAPPPRKLFIPLGIADAVDWAYKSVKDLMRPESNMDDGRCKKGFTVISRPPFGDEQEDWCATRCKPHYKGIDKYCVRGEVVAKDNYGRGLGSRLACDPGKERSGLLCYPECLPGYHGRGPMCWETCAANEMDGGLYCSSGAEWHFKKSIGRGVGSPLSLQCRPGLERSGLLCYPPCKQGYTGVGPRCWKPCPPKYKSAGPVCIFGSSYERKVYVAPEPKPTPPPTPAPHGPAPYAPAYLPGRAPPAPPGALIYYPAGYIAAVPHTTQPAGPPAATPPPSAGPLAPPPSARAFAPPPSARAFAVDPNFPPTPSAAAASVAPSATRPNSVSGADSEENLN